MIYTSVFIQCTIFIASYVHCAREPPADFFEDYDYREDDCIRLNHVLSHINYRGVSAMSLDMICETRDDEYHLVSFAEPRQLVLRLVKATIKICKVNYDATVISFTSLINLRGQATLYFEFIEDARYFNKDVYPSLRSNLKFCQITGRIDQILTTEPKSDKKSVARRYAKVFFEDGLEPIKFVVEADGVAEPALVFIQDEFHITIDKDQTENITKAELKIGEIIYEIHFESAEEGKIFTYEMSLYTDERTYLTRPGLATE